MKKRVGLVLVLAAVAIAIAGFSLVGQGQEQPPECPSVPQDYIINGTVFHSNYTLAGTNLTLNHSVNVSIYNLTFSQVGEPVRELVNWTTTNTSINPGNFTVAFTASCSTPTGPVFYSVDAVYYNSSGWAAREVGPQFPPLPINVLSTFFKPGVIYLQDATTLDLYGINTTGDVINFSYIIFDNSLGFPLAENFATKVWNASVVVPRNRNYTVVFMRPPDFTDPNSFATAVPPMTYSVTTGMIEGNATNQYVLNLTQNMSFSQFHINGTINITGNTSAVNVTHIVLRLGLAGLMPPNADISIPNGVVINNMSVGSAASGFMIANYSVTVMGAPGNGIYQVLEFYASNSSGTGDSFAYFQNFSVTGHTTFNVTLNGMAGAYSSQTMGSSTVPTRYVAINITDENDEPLSDAHIELKVAIPGHKTTLPTFRYMLAQLSGGIARLPILNTSNATVLVYNRRYAPLEFKLNLTNASLYPNGIINIQLQTFKPRQFNPDGTVEELSSSNKGGNFHISIMQNSPACNVYNASISDCKLGDNNFTAGDFDPLKSMVSGKVGIYSVMNTTGVVIHFVGVDMLASGPPEGAMSEQPLRDEAVGVDGGAVRKQIWRFGSLAPPIYDKVLIGIPYNESLYNDSALFNISFDYLFDENGVVIWNATLDPNATAVPDAYSDYNVSWFNSTGGGMRCVTDERIDINAQQCYVNTSTNYVWLNIPHFSDVDPPLEGTSDTTPPKEAPSAVAFDANTTSGNVNITWTDSDDETGETYIVYRFNSNISVFNHSLANLTINRVGEGVGSFLDNTTDGSNGSTRYSYAVVAVDSAGNLNTSSGAVNLSDVNTVMNVTVNDTVKPKSPTGLNISGAGTATATLMWLNVTQDVDGNPDMHGMQYKVYRSGVNLSDSNTTGSLNLSGSGNTANASRAISGATITTVSSNTTTFSIGAGGTGTYHFIVTSVDDGGSENLSWQMAASYFNVSLNEAAASSGSSGSSSGGSSGGGGGGTATDDTAGTSQSRVWDVIAADAEVTFTVSKTDIPFKSVSFSVTEEVSDVEVTVTKLGSKPSYVAEDYAGKVHSYLTVAKSNLKDTSVTGVKITFIIPKKWLTDNSALSSDVVLIRYDRGEWNELPTEVTDSDVLTFTFEATSPGLSAFAIAVRPEITADSDAEDEDAGEELEADAEEEGASGDESADGTAGGAQKSKALLFTAIAIIVIAVAVGAAGFVYYRKSKAAELGDEEPSKPKEKENG